MHVDYESKIEQQEISGIAENATEEQDRVDGYANEAIHEEEGNVSQKSNDKSGEPTRRIRRPPKYVNDYVLSWKIEKKSSAA